MTRGPVSYEAFRQRVRRHRRSDVLFATARLAAHLHQAEYGQREPPAVPNFVSSFALAGIAHAALVHANEFRDSGVTLGDLIQMADYYVNVEDPALELEPGGDRLRGVMTRLAYEQFPFQFSLMENVGRTLPLLVDHLPSCGGPSSDDWSDAIGVSMEDLVRLAFIMTVAVTQNGGRIARSVLRMAHVAPIFTPYTPDQALLVIDRLLAATPQELGETGRQEQVAGLEKWSFNPLTAKPLVVAEDDLIAPAPRLILERVSPTGLYFDGLDAWGTDFTNALGCAFQRYVGEQLTQLQYAQIHPEVIFGRPEVKTVDFFIVTASVVVLVEAKASRPVIATRQGQPGGDDDYLRKIGHAFGQIDQTAGWVEEGHAALAHIPQDRPLRGLVVTLEPFHLVNTLVYECIAPATRIAVTVTSSHELEGVVAALAGTQDTGSRLLGALTPDPPAPASLSNAIEGLPSTGNPILEDAWDRFTAILETVPREQPSD